VINRIVQPPVNTDIGDKYRWASIHTRIHTHVGMYSYC